MVRIGTRLGDDVYDASKRLSEFRLIVVRLNFEFLDRVDDRSKVVVANKGAEVVCTVKHEQIAAIALSVDRREGKGTEGVTSECTTAVRVLATLTGLTPGVSGSNCV